MFANFVRGLFRGKQAPPDPWNALSLDWQVESPPPTENFREIPTVEDWPYGYAGRQ